MLIRSDDACLEEDRLRGALVLGRFVASGDNSRILRHLVASCPRCSRRLKAVASDPSMEVDLALLARNAIRSWDGPPVPLILGRFVSGVRGTGDDAFLPFVERCLLHGVLRTGCWGFLLKWFLVEVTRSLAPNDLGTSVARWQRLAETLSQHPCGRSDLDEQLGILVRACRWHALLGTGDLVNAHKGLEEMAARGGRSLPAIRGSLLEMQGEMYRCLGRPRLAVAVYERAMDVLKDFEIPDLADFRIRGRRAETRVGLGLSHLLLGDRDIATRNFKEAEASIPNGADPVLRHVICRYVCRAASLGGTQELPDALRKKEPPEISSNGTIPAYFFARWLMMDSKLLDGMGDFRRWSNREHATSGC